MTKIDFLGLEFTKPDDWGFLSDTWLDYTQEQTADISQKVADRTIDRIIFNMIYKPELDTPSRPTIHCTLTYYNEYDYNNLISEIIPIFNHAYPIVNILSEMNEFKLSNKICKSFVLEVGFEANDLIRIQPIAVRYDSFFITFFIACPLENLSKYDELMNPILESIRISERP